MGTPQSSTVPRHAAIAHALRNEILSGELMPGSPLPSEAQLSARFAVSRGTIRHALAALRAEGLIVGGRGRAPVVRRPGLAQSFDQLVSFSMWARQLGRTPSARTLELARRPADLESAEQLGLEPGAPVFQYKRLRLLDGEPVMIERTTMIEAIGRLLLDCDLDGGSVYAQLGARGVVFSEADQTIAAIAAGADDAALLSIPRRAPLLEVRRRALDPQGRVLEWARDRYRADAFEITIHNQHALPRAGVALRAAPPPGVRAARP
ncbi:MAG TPA: GntR family transcriptional regulator [Solirubrobacteraceae bacterium]|nr:GntR family transcriptional regulator [Solirubrobacteraceae bacterium]